MLHIILGNFSLNLRGPRLKHSDHTVPEAYKKNSEKLISGRFTGRWLRALKESIVQTSIISLDNNNKLCSVHVMYVPRSRWVMGARRYSSWATAQIADPQPRSVTAGSRHLDDGTRASAIAVDARRHFVHGCAWTTVRLRLSRQRVETYDQMTSLQSAE